MVEGGRHLVLRAKGKRTAPGSSRVKGGTAQDPGERTWEVSAQLVSQCRLTMTLWQLQLTSLILLMGRWCPLSTDTWPLYITTPHLDPGGGAVCTSGPTHTRYLSQPGVP